MLTRLLLCLLGVIANGSHAFKNNATEDLQGHVVIPSPDTPSNASLNRPRTGGRREKTRDDTEQHHVGCRVLRSTKYISDGQCTSLNPVKELVCAGECLPTHLLPNWIGGGHYWSRRDVPQWRCVTDRTRVQRISLQCRDGSTRTYKVTAVTSCKCKNYTKGHNHSSRASEGQASQKPKKKKSNGGNAKLTSKVSIKSEK